MSSWARSWAYEQSVGTEVDGKWRKNPGAKSVLAAVCEFPDQDGRCYVGQATLAQMTDMSERTVREHLRFLEHDAGLIRREERRRSDGTRTSDYIWVLAPVERLRPPQPAKSAAGDSSTGKSRRDNRQITSHQPARFAGPLLNYPSGDPSEVRTQHAAHDEQPVPVDRKEERKAFRERREAEYRHRIDEALKDDGASELVRDFIALKEDAMTRGTKSARAVWTQIVAPYLRWRDDASLNISLEARVAGLEVAVAKNARSINLARAVAEDYRPPRPRGSASGRKPKSQWAERKGEEETEEWVEPQRSTG